MKAYLRSGEIVRPHGVVGAVKIQPLTADLARFGDLSDAYIEQRGVYTPIKVLSCSAPNAASIVLKIEGVDTREAAEALRGAFLCVDRAHAVKLPENSYFVADLIDCEIYDSEGKLLGKLTDVLETGANDVYKIEGERNFMVPALRKLLKEVDIENQRIVFDKAVLEEVCLFED